MMSDDISKEPSLEQVELWASKVTADWPSNLMSQLNQGRLKKLPQAFRNGKVDNMAKVRLMVACLFLPTHEQQSAQEYLQQLSAAAADDQDEWVRVVAAAVGNYATGQVDTAALVQGPNANRLVADTLQGLWNAMDKATTPSGFRPLQEAYMHPSVLPPAANHGRSQSPSPGLVTHNHFTVRGDPDGGGNPFPLAPPPLDMLISGEASITGLTADAKGLRRPAAQVQPAVASMFRPSHTETGNAQHHSMASQEQDAQHAQQYYEDADQQQPPHQGTHTAARSNSMNRLGSKDMTTGSDDWQQQGDVSHGGNSSDHASQQAQHSREQRHAGNYRPMRVGSLQLTESLNLGQQAMGHHRGRGRGKSHGSSKPASTSRRGKAHLDTASSAEVEAHQEHDDHHAHEDGQHDADLNRQDSATQRYDEGVGGGYNNADQQMGHGGAHQHLDYGDDGDGDQEMQDAHEQAHTDQDGYDQDREGEHSHPQSRNHQGLKRSRDDPVQDMQGNSGYEELEDSDAEPVVEQQDEEEI